MADVRDPWNTPFSSDSVFNLPIGSGAQWTFNEQLAAGQPFVNTTESGWNANLYKGDGSDPLVTVTVSGAAGGPAGTYQIHIPAGAVPAGGTDHMLAIDDTSTHTWYALGGFDFTGPNTATASQGSAEPDYDNGLGGNSQNSNWDNEVGVITEHDLQSGVIDHMLNVALPTTMLHSYSSTSTDVLAPNAWPQSSEDGFALNGNGGPAYSGTVDYGITMGIPVGTPEPAAVAANPGAHMLWTALMDHGGMVRNSGGGGNEIVLTATQDVDPNDPLIQGINDPNLGQQIFQHVRILANQGPNSINGGGTPIIALDPPLSDAPGSTPVPTPTPTPTMGAGPIEIFPGDGNSFQDGAGNVYSLSGDGHAMENNAPIAGGAGTAAMEWYNAQVYGEDGNTGQWYTWNQQYWASAVAPPEPTSTPTPPPTPTPNPTPSPTATEIFPGDGHSFQDDTGNTYTLSADHHAVENGTNIPGGGGTGAMELYNHQVYGQDAASGSWYTWDQHIWSSSAAPPQLSGSPTPTPTPTTVQAAVATEIFRGSGTLTDGSGNTYTLASNGSAMENGSYIPAGGGTSAMEITDGQVYGQDAASKQWYTWDQQNWTPSADPNAVSAQTISVGLAETPDAGVNAKFILTIDGAQAGSAQEVTALQSSGVLENFMFSGDFGSGQHDIGITFTDPSATRTLHVGSISYDGENLTGVPIMLNSSATSAHFAAS